MPGLTKSRELKVKSGAEYWKLVETTAHRVESWPEWKTGEPAIVSQQETNASKRPNGDKRRETTGKSAPKR